LAPFETAFPDRKADAVFKIETNAKIIKTNFISTKILNYDEWMK